MKMFLQQDGRQDAVITDHSRTESAVVSKSTREGRRHCWQHNLCCNSNARSVKTQQQPAGTATALLSSGTYLQSIDHFNLVLFPHRLHTVVEQGVDVVLDLLNLLAI